jgi:hypothetical protein
MLPSSASFAGGALVLLVAGALAVAGGVALAAGIAQRRPVVLALGLALLAPPAIVLGILLVTFVPEAIPRTREWDLRADRHVSRLDATPSGDAYYYQGNLRTTIALPGGLGWSGRASHVVFRRRGDAIERIEWQGRREDLPAAVASARRILGELGLDAAALDAWHERAAGSADATTFHSRSEEGRDPGIGLRLRGYAETENAPITSWSLLVDVTWREPAP